MKTESELIKDYQEVIDNVRKFNPKAQVKGVLVQEMVQDGYEVIVGISKDPQFGPTILFGLGGIFTELLRDVSLRVPPITRYDAEDMVKEIKGYRVLQGFRGKPKADLESIIDVLLKVSRLSIDLRESIKEMDINPLIVLPEGMGAKAVDTRIVMPK